MLDLVKTEVAKNHKLLATKGVFFSLFDKDGTMVFSKGMVQADKSLGQIIDIFHHNFFAKLVDVQLVVVDIVTHLEELYSYDMLEKIDFTKNGVAVQQVEGEIWGVILPNTEGIADIKQLFSLLKKKNNLSGDIKVYLFQTDRISIDVKNK